MMEDCLLIVVWKDRAGSYTIPVPLSMSTEVAGRDTKGREGSSRSNKALPLSRSSTGFRAVNPIAQAKGGNTLGPGVRANRPRKQATYRPVILEHVAYTRVNMILAPGVVDNTSPPQSVSLRPPPPRLRLHASHYPSEDQGITSLD